MIWGIKLCYNPAIYNTYTYDPVSLTAKGMRDRWFTLVHRNPDPTKRN
jgi:hypothetical protein